MKMSHTIKHQGDCKRAFNAMTWIASEMPAAAQLATRRG